MSIIVSGHLHVTVIEQEGIPARAATLTCELGTFVVQSDLLSRLPAGHHSGYFAIGEIVPLFKQQAGKFYWEMSTQVHQIALNVVPVLPANEAEARETLVAEDDDLSSDDLETLADAEEADSADMALFGHLWPLQQNLSLDSTHDRKHLLAQGKRLQELGYRFNPKAQVWYSAA